MCQQVGQGGRLHPLELFKRSLGGSSFANRANDILRVEYPAIGPADHQLRGLWIVLEQRFSALRRNACLALFGLGPQSTLGAHCGPAPGAGARLARPAGRRSLRFVCPLSPLGAGNTTWDDLGQLGTTKTELTR